MKQITKKLLKNVTAVRHPVFRKQNRKLPNGDI